MKKLIISLIGLLLIPSLLYAGTTSSSGVTAQTIIDRTRRDLSAVGDTFFNDTTDMIQWIDEAVKIIVNKTRCLESGASNIMVYPNVRTYSISKNFLDVEVVEHDSGDTTDPTQIFTLDRVEKSDIGHNKEKGRPKNYCVWSNSLEIWPIPRSDQSGTTLYLYTINLPSGVTTASSRIETPAYFDPVIPFYVKAKGSYKDKAITVGDKFLAMFYAMVDEYLTKVLRRKPTE